MKILQILPALDLGGVERGVVDLARAMKRRGHETVVISSGGELVSELQKIGVPHYTLPVHRKSFFSLFLIPRLIEVIEREKIDIVHARSRVPAWLAWFAALATRRPFVTTCHGYYSAHPLSWIMGWGKRVIVISRVIGRHMIDDFKVPPDKIRLVHRGVDLSEFSESPAEEKPAFRERSFRIINVGRFSPIKGQVEFLKAVHLVHRKHPDLEVWLVGSEQKGRTRYTETIRQTIQQLHLGGCVKILGTRRDIPGLLKEADLLVLPTLVPEAFGRVVIEAGAVGTPVLATGLGGVLDIIEHGRDGLLVSPGDIQGMAQAIEEIMKDPARGRALAANLKARVQEEFNLEKMAEATCRVYQEIISEKRILLIKLGSMGDLILAVPSFRMIRRRFPDAHLALLIDRRLGQILSGIPYVNEIIPVDRRKFSRPGYLLRIAKRLRREDFDLSVDFQNSKWTHLLSFLGGARERYGFSRGMFGFLLNRPDRSFSVSDSPVRHQHRILSKLGVREFDEDLELWADPSAERSMEEKLLPHLKEGEKLIGFVVGSSPNWPTKRWPAAYFQELAARLVTEAGGHVILIGSSEDAAAGAVWQHSEGVLNLIGKTSLAELVPLIRKLDVLVTGDTAPLHVAAAVQTKIVALFGPTDPKRHMPPAQGARVLASRLPCQPCYSGVCRNPDNLACLKQISVTEVRDAVLRQLSQIQKVPHELGARS